MKLKDKNIKRIVLFLFVFTCVVYAAVLLRAILFKYVRPYELFSPDRFYTRNINLIPFSGYISRRKMLEDVLVNLFLYAPFGFLLSMKSKGKKYSWLLLIIPVATSILFESLQYILSLGGTDITDVIMNTLGAVLGFCFYSVTAQIFKNSEKLDRAYTIIMSLCAVIVLILMI